VRVGCCTERKGLAKARGTLVNRSVLAQSLYHDRLAGSMNLIVTLSRPN
jgi:hypothetical protein